MNISNFLEAYETELQEACSTETQLVQALPKLAEVAHCAALKQVIELHCDETREHKRRVEDLLRRLDVKSDEHTDQSMQAMIHEIGKLAGMVEDVHLRDAELIASLQRVEHYEIAMYGTLAAWAKQLGLNEDLRTLHEILEQEKQADCLLTSLAEADVNPRAGTLAA